MPSNPAQFLYSKIPPAPEHVFFFGAGASYGSDARHFLDRGLLPPLGGSLYEELCNAPELEHWKGFPSHIDQIFRTCPFEEGMSALDEWKEGAKKSLWRDIELSLFFSRYRPKPSNLYWKLGSRVGRRLKKGGWTGAAITLNYERLLEESFMRNRVFTVVKGVTFYDDNLPLLATNQLFEVCYPHGGCQFFMNNDWLKGVGDVVFSETARFLSKSGANHLLKASNIPIACARRQIPLICRYHPSKRAALHTYFTATQQQRSNELIHHAKMLTIVGVQCFHQVDVHIWGPLAETKAFIVYVEPGKDGQKKFRDWSNQNGKAEGRDYRIISKTFRDAFDLILQINEL